MDQSKPVAKPRVGRLAPSPTGGLHLGHARSFLIAWLAARSLGGRIVLRIEDLDATRARPEAVTGAIDDLHWLGLDWDEGPDVGGPSAPYVQSERTTAYGEALASLIRFDAVYPCTCTRSDIERASSAPHAGESGPTYPGTCSGRSAEDATRLDGRRFVWRFRVPSGPIRWTDEFLGPVALEPSRLGGDFVVARSTGEFAYQLAVVVDDAAMGVTQVVRGDDLVDSTPRQILLYRAFGWPMPDFAHVPLVVGPDGRRLAKRDGSIRLATLRELGADPRRLVGQLAASCGWSSTPPPSYAADWMDRFAWESIPRSPWMAEPAAILDACRRPA